ncbi:hypothetical protein Tco_1027032 [Tanacetum coccineum]
MTTSKPSSLIGMRSISIGWYNKVSIVMGGIFSLEARDMDMKLLSALESNNTLARFLGQMAHLVTSITLDSARSYVMQSAFLTQRTVSSIPIVFSWGGIISHEGFPSSVLLLLVIIVAVVGVGVTVVIVKFFFRQTFVCDHLILTPECALLPDPLAYWLC